MPLEVFQGEHHYATVVLRQVHPIMSRYQNGMEGARTSTQKFYIKYREGSTNFEVAVL